MKKLIAGALALAIGFGSAFAQEEPLGQIGSLSSSAGKISFGAWGRSTFNIGSEYTAKKTTATAKVSDTVATAAAAGTLAKSLQAASTAAASGDLTALTAISTKYPNAVAAATAVAGNTDIPANLKEAATVKAIMASGDIGAAEIAAARSQIASGIETPIASDTSDVEWYASVAPDWSYGCRVGFWIIGRTNDEKWGFDFNLDSDAAALFVGAQNYDSNSTIGSLKQKNGGLSYAESGKYAVAIGDQAKIWGIFDEIPLVDVKVAFGKMREQELRGSIGDFGQRESSDVRSEDDIFTEMWPVMGLFTSVKGKKGSALEGLYVAADCDAFGLVSSANESNKEFKTKLSTLASTIQGGVGYTIPGLMQLKTQFIADSIDEGNKKYSAAKYADARAAGYDWSSYPGRFEFGIDWLGFAGGATGLADVDLDKTPNANLIELGVKVPVVTESGLRQYDPEKFYNFYACLGTMGVIQKGFILYKAHVWGGQGETNLVNYTKMEMAGSKANLNYTGNAANIIMAGFDALAEVCINPFGAQNNFLGLSFNYNITNATTDGTGAVMAGGKAMSQTSDIKLQQHNFGVEVYFKKTFAANNYFFIGVADRLSIQKLEGTMTDVSALDSTGSLATLKALTGEAVGVDLSYTATTNKVYIPVGVEMFF